jgi:hypothetical protein
MPVHGSLVGEGISVGDDPRLTLSGWRTLEVYWLGYWLPRLDDSGFFAPGRPAIPQLIDEIVERSAGGSSTPRRAKNSAWTTFAPRSPKPNRSDTAARSYWHPTPTAIDGRSSCTSTTPAGCRRLPTCAWGTYG